ncbi:MAG: hypothetical protein KKH98_01130 [Spirochaetes bacterium]|nr:hypothetical protein [Spirochaetota bacterium]
MIIIIFLLIPLIQCASDTMYTNKDVQKPSETIKTSDIHAGLEGDFLFYVSNDNSAGDVWLYNLNSNNKWQITRTGEEDLRIISFSPSYKFMIYHTEKEKNVIYNIGSGDEMDFYSSYNQEYKFSPFNDVCWNDAQSFYFLSSTNNLSTNIFFAELNKDEEWVFNKLDLARVIPGIQNENIYSMALSYNKELLAYIARDPVGQMYIYIYNLKQEQNNKLTPVRQKSELVWSENNKNIYFYDDMTIYSINFQGAKELAVSSSKKIYRMKYHPDSKFKFLYILNSDNYFFLYVKNVDYMGAGDFYCNVMNLNDFCKVKGSDLLFYDNTGNEIYYFNTKTSEIRKIIDHASLYKLTP